MPKKFISNWKIVLAIMVAVFLTVWLYQKSFSSYFFQDDWYSFRISQARNLEEILRFFWPLTDVIYYRPLGMQVPFFIFWKLFGINPLPFRIATLIIHLLNGVLVFRLFNYFVKNKFLSYFGSLLYLTSAVHSTVFLWAATFAFVLAPAFYFSSFYAFIKNKYLFSLTAFFVGMLVNEILITLPLLLTVWQLFFIKKGKKLHLIPYWLVAVVYVFFRLLIAKFPTSGGYALLTDTKQFFFNIRNYILWSFNWPEEIHKQFITFLGLNPEFIKNFKLYVAVFLIAMLAYLIFMIIIPLCMLLYKKKLDQSTISIIAYGILWFFITLFPVLYFAKHYFAYYLPIPLFGFLLISMVVLNIFLNQIKKNISNNYYLIIIIVFGSWYYAAIINIRFNQYVHWAPKRAIISEKLIQKIKFIYPVLPHDVTVIIGENPDIEENKWALGDQSGLQVIYNNPEIKTIFVNKQEYLINKDKLKLPLNSTDIINYDL